MYISVPTLIWGPQNVPATSCQPYMGHCVAAEVALIFPPYLSGVPLCAVSFQAYTGYIHVSTFTYFNALINLCCW